MDCDAVRLRDCWGRDDDPMVVAVRISEWLRASFGPSAILLVGRTPWQVLVLLNHASKDDGPQASGRSYPAVERFPERRRVYDE